MHCDELSVCRFWHSKLSNTGNLYRKELACHVEEWRPVTENDTWAGHYHEYWTSFYGSLSISMDWHSFVATFVLSPRSVLLNHRAVAQCRWNEAIAKKDFRMKQNPLQWRQFDYNNSVYRGSVDWTYCITCHCERDIEYFMSTSYSCLPQKEGEVTWPLALISWFSSVDVLNSTWSVWNMHWNLLETDERSWDPWEGPAEYLGCAQYFERFGDVNTFASDILLRF